MKVTAYTLVFVMGLIMGGLVNLCLCSISKGGPVPYSIAYCIKCGNRLGRHQTITAVDCILHKGMCGFCHNRILMGYPVVVLINAILCTAAYHRFGFNVFFIKSVVLLFLIILSSVIDLKDQVIPDEITAPGLAVGIFFMLIDPSRSTAGALLGFIAGGGVLLTVAALFSGGMGGGDIKLMAVIGVYLGWQLILVTIFVSFISGGIAAILLLLTGKKHRKDKMPFGPFIAGATIIALFWGDWIINYYLSVV